jgi:hypothetical protein
MTTAAIGSPGLRTIGRLGCWPSVRHSLRVEAAGAVTVYGLYQVARGLVGADAAEADAHAHRLLHLAVTAELLLWLHRRRPEGFPFVRTALLVASGLALVGFLVYPTAPPRLAGVGMVDTVSGGHVDLNRGLVSSVHSAGAAPELIEYLNGHGTCTQRGNGLAGHNGCLVLGRG